MSNAVKVTARQAIIKVMTAAEATTKSKAMKVPAIIEATLKVRNLGLTGPNRGQTIYSILYSDNKKADGDFKSVGKGLFILNPKAKRLQPAKPAPAKAAPAKAAKAAEVTPDPKPESNKRGTGSGRKSRAKQTAAA